MERLGDDELWCIFMKLNEEKDRKSFRLVSKQLMKVACRRLRKLSSSFPDLLFDILPQSSNLVRFSCLKPLTNNHLKLLAQSCLKLSNLYILRPDCDFESDFDDDGLCALANSCRNLRVVQVNYRLNVGDAGIKSLVRSCSKNLMSLVVSGCVKITDELLKVIGEECYLHQLVLSGCNLITDSGLNHLVNKDLKYHLRNLDLSGCDKISDDGIICLKKIVKLEDLNLLRCGNNVTDYGIVNLLMSQQSYIRTLYLGWVVNVSDVSLAVMGSNCLKLNSVSLVGCKAITNEGLRAFANHPTLSYLNLLFCNQLSRKVVKSLALNCPSLGCIWLGSRINPQMPADKVYNIKNCRISWYNIVGDNRKRKRNHVSI